MDKSKLTFILVFLLGMNLVSAHNGGHDDCFNNLPNDCPLGHGPGDGPDGIPGTGDECPWTDPECGSNPSDGCDVRQDTTFIGGTYSLPNGIDLCNIDITLDCNNSLLSGNFFNKNVGISNFGGRNTITGCIIKDYTTGINTGFGHNNTIKYNNIWGSGSVEIGIRINNSESNILAFNNITLYEPSTTPILIDSSHYNIVYLNIVSVVYDDQKGILLLSSDYNNITSNIDNETYWGDTIISLNDSHYNDVYSNIGDISLYESDFNNISKNIINSTSDYGISIKFSDFNKIDFNDILNKQVSAIAITDNSRFNNISYNKAFSDSGAGIFLFDSHQNNVNDNNFSSNSWYSVALLDSNYSTFTNNTIYPNVFGEIMLNNSHNNFFDYNTGAFRLVGSDNNTLVQNKANSTLDYGFYLLLSDRNRLYSNYVLNSQDGIYAKFSDFNEFGDNTVINSGITLEESDENIVHSSGVDKSISLYSSDYNDLHFNSGNPLFTEELIFLNDSHHNSINRNWGGAKLVSSDYNFIEDNLVKPFLSGSNYWDLVIIASDYNTIVKNNISNSLGSGIFILDSYFNELKDNSISNNQDNGIVLNGVYFNIIENNNIFNNKNGIDIRTSGYNNFTSNTFCPSNTNLDFISSYDGVSGNGTNLGFNNKCDKPGAWNDTGIVGCTFKCGPIIVSGGNINSYRFPFCTDTDGGKYYYKKGQVTNSSGTYPDVCLGRDILREYYCDGNTAKSVLHRCGGMVLPEICVNGACRHL